VDVEASQNIEIKPIYWEEGMVPEFYLFPGLRVIPVEGKGLGVMTTLDLHKGQIIECCPMMLLTPAKCLDPEWAKLHQTMLETIFSDYRFCWTARNNAVALGYGGLYNHSEHPNVDMMRLTKSRRMVVVANQDIDRGTELTFTYKTVWFEPVDPVAPALDGPTTSAHAD
jgi:hypothetical protein